MWTALALGKQEVLATVKHPVRGGRNGNSTRRRRSRLGEAGVQGRNFEDPGQARQKGGGPARFQNEFMGPDEHARLGKQVGIDIIRFDNRQDLAVDQVKHILPDVRRHCLEASGNCRPTDIIGAGTEPHF
jgi:hypothetical protein